MSIKISSGRLLLYLFLIMPVVDSFSGIFHETFNIGPIYRIFIFAYIYVLILKYCLRRAVIFFLVLSIFIICQFLANPYTVTESVEATVKLFTPIEMILMYTTIHEKNIFFSDKDINSLLDGWAIIYPVSIFTSFMFGGNIFAYENAVGVKGFYYATNEVSFVICAIVLCKAAQFAEYSEFRDLCLIFLNSLCIILMGTKSGYMTLVIGFALYVLYWIMKRRGYKSLYSLLKGFIYFIIIAIAILAIREKVAIIVNGIFERWRNSRIYISQSTIDFLSSGRLRRVDLCFNTWINNEWWYPIIGWGLGTIDRQRENMEMDFLDLLFRCGITGFTIIIAYYISLVKGKLRLDYWNVGILTTAIIIVFFAGHTLFGGASGMALGILIIYCLNRSKKNCEKMSKGRERRRYEV